MMTPLRLKYNTRVALMQRSVIKVSNESDRFVRRALS